MNGTRSGLAVQLYTVRDFMDTPADFAETLSKIAQIGYRAVQLSAVGAMGGESPAVTALDAKKMLDDSGLACIATHRSWDKLVHYTSEEIEFHQTLNCPYIAIGGIPPEYGKLGAEGYKSFVKDAVPVIAQFKAAGIGFGHHNHAHEFAKYDGKNTLWDILIVEGGADYLLEIDIYWAWHAGVDPAVLLSRMKNRVPVIHLKDKEVVAGEKEPAIAAIGEGNLPWDDTILPACHLAGVQWYCIEQDTCRRDPFDCLASSYAFLAARGLG